jgi:hypothetical protein
MKIGDRVKYAGVIVGYREEYNDWIVKIKYSSYLVVNALTSINVLLAIL